jgi:16S rRNA (uracil1498-N3)-methyltransferase
VSGAGEPTAEITVALAVVQPVRFEAAVEKCAELGARRIVPLKAERCMVGSERLKPDRLKRIAFEAAKQAGRSWFPKIGEPVAVDSLASESPLLAALQGTDMTIGEAICRLGKIRRLAIAIGPEGDFTDSEHALLESFGALAVSLGGLTLRSETAAMAAVALAVDAFGRSKK